MPESELKLLIERISQGDKKAMDQFYRLTESRIHRFARSRLNDSFAAADILNETMIDIWKGAGRFQGRSKVLTWALGIANHKVIDMMRKQNRHKNEELDDNAPDTTSLTPEVEIDNAVDYERLRDCLAHLSEKHRAVLHLAFFEDMPYGEIAAVVGCPEGTVKTRVFHAKEALKRCLVQITA